METSYSVRSILTHDVLHNQRPLKRVRFSGSEPVTSQIAPCLSSFRSPPPSLKMRLAHLRVSTETVKVSIQTFLEKCEYPDRKVRTRVLLKAIAQEILRIVRVYRTILESPANESNAFVDAWIFKLQYTPNHLTQQINVRKTHHSYNREFWMLNNKLRIFAWQLPPYLRLSFEALLVEIGELLLSCARCKNEEANALSNLKNTLENIEEKHSNAVFS